MSLPHANILVTGGRGQLARELLRIDSQIDAPTRDQMDFSRYDSIQAYFEGKLIQTVIHAGAVTNRIDGASEEAWIESNIIGTANLALWCARQRLRLVYISSDYVYPGERGDFTEESPLFPVNRYAKSKLGGEMAVQLCDRSLIIRTSFYAEQRFAKACTDQWTSRMPIREAAQAIYDLARRPDVQGIINLGAEHKRSLFEIVQKEFEPAAQGIRRHELNLPYRIPPDSSLDTSKFQHVKGRAEEASKTIDRCRVCRSAKLRPYLDLGTTPLANSYLTQDQLSDAEFKEALTLQLCLGCGLSQLTKVVDPQRMFKTYLYVSSTPATFRAHCGELARTGIELAGGQDQALALDIGSNDGCLLSEFRRSGWNVVGVDPAENLSAEANQKGIPTLCAYWSPAIAQDIVSRFGAPRVITSTNVLAHTDDVHAFAEGIVRCLHPEGVWIAEVPYLLDFIRHNEFDTAYHEHLSYFHLHALSALVKQYHLQIFDVDYFPKLHGGTLRIKVCRERQRPVHARVLQMMRKEAAFGVRKAMVYQRFRDRVLNNKKHLVKMLGDLRKDQKTVWAYGASAKGNTLMNFFGLTRDTVPVVIDDNPKKWGYYTPGSRMRITVIDELAKNNVDYLLLLAWNFKDEIIRRCQAVGYRGGFILPVPAAQLVKPLRSEKRGVVLA